MVLRLQSHDSLVMGFNLIGMLIGTGSGRESMEIKLKTKRKICY